MDKTSIEQAAAHGGVVNLRGDRSLQDRARVLEAAGELVRTGRRTAIAATTPSSLHQRLCVVELEIGEPLVFTGLVGGWLYGFPHAPQPCEPFTVLVPSMREPAPVPGAQIVRTAAGDLLGSRVIQGLPVASREVTLRYMAVRLNRQRMVTLLQDELRLRHTTESRLRAVLGRGRAGSSVLRPALDEAGDGAHSRSERVLHRAFRRRLGPVFRAGVRVETTEGRPTFWTSSARC